MRDRNKLARIINVRERVRDVKRAELAEANDAMNVARVHAERANNMLDDAIHRLTESGETSAIDLVDRAARVTSAKSSASSAHENLETQQAAQSRRMEALILANRDVRVLETVDDRLKRQEKLATLRREQALADEVAGRRGMP